MNPYLEENWSDVHTALIGFIREALAEDLPPDLSARAEERILLEGEGEDPRRHFRTDVAVIEPWRAGLPPVYSPDNVQKGGTALAIAEPLFFSGTIMPERWVEIHDAHGNLITVLEIISPANKTGAGTDSYRRRQHHFLAAGVNLVEIDLIRSGIHVVAVEAEKLPPAAGTHYIICVSRIRDDDARVHWEVYPCPLREALPTIRVPLRLGERDVTLALQGLVDRCYRTGRYWLGGPVRPLSPPPADEAETAWIEERLRTSNQG